MEFENIHNEEDWDAFIKRLSYDGEGFAPHPITADKPKLFPVIAAYIYISDNGGENEGWIVGTTQTGTGH